MQTKTYKKRNKTDVVGKGFEIFLLVFLIVYCISLLIPLIWMLFSSFKSFDDYILNSFGLPKSWKFSNYSEVFKVFKVAYKGKNGGRITYGFLPMTVYSIIWTFGASTVHVIITSMCAYALAGFEFKGKNFIYNLGIVVMIVPIVGSTPSALILREQLGIRNNMLPLMLTSESCAFSGLHFLLLYAAFKGVSMTYREAVYIDGGNNYTAFFKVILPMIIPSMVAVFVLKFLVTWTDYSTFIIWLPSYPSLAVGMYLFEQSATKTGVSMPVVLATFVVVIIPTTALYFATQNVLMSKFTVGGLKG
ncbi:MAG: carbohydrate ABC transporter permease [Clostridia bacterium]|nr:carbohydrate ABC transporter permease [Clostridia bacterium]